MHVSGHNLFDRLGLERHVTRQRMVKRAAQAVHVRKEVFALTLDFFRCYIVGRSPNRAFVFVFF